MLKDKYDAEIERMMNEEGLSHSEAMKAYEKKNKKNSDDDEGEEESGSDKALRLPASLFPDNVEGKEINFSVSGVVEENDGEMVTIKCNNLHCDVREPYKEKTANQPAVEAPR